MLEVVMRQVDKKDTIKCTACNGRGDDGHFNFGVAIPPCSVCRGHGTVLRSWSEYYDDNGKLVNTREWAVEDRREPSKKWLRYVKSRDSGD